jgi:hypothetical protein
MRYLPARGRYLVILRRSWAENRSGWFSAQRYGAALLFGSALPFPCDQTGDFPDALLLCCLNRRR